MTRRRSIHLPNVSYTAPIPMGARVGSIVYSSGISGQDPQTGQLPEDPAAQA